MDRTPDRAITLTEPDFIPFTKVVNGSSIRRALVMKDMADISLSLTRYTFDDKYTEAINEAIISPSVRFFTSTYISTEEKKYIRKTLITCEKGRLMPNVCKRVLRRRNGFKSLGGYTEGMPKSTSSHR
ncbi:MAG: hypothetical protein QW702_01630 [Candidatus Bathyarchaeia archaeon]